jgi:hypothetical protein
MGHMLVMGMDRRTNCGLGKSKLTKSLLSRA